MPRRKDPVRLAVGKYANARRWRPEDHVGNAGLLRDIRVERLAVHVEEVVTDTPGLTHDQQQRLVALIVSGGESCAS